MANATQSSKLSKRATMATLNCFQTNPAAFATPASSLAYVQQASDADPANGFYVRCDLIVQCLNTRQGLFPAPL